MKYKIKHYLGIRLKYLSQQIQIPKLDMPYGLSITIRSTEDLNKIGDIVNNLDGNNLIYLQIDINRLLFDERAIRKPFPKLHHLKDLQYLDIECYHLQENDCESLNLSNLKRISLKTVHMDKNALCPFTKCPKLFSVAIDTESIHLANYSFLSSLKELKYLSIDSHSVPDQLYDMLTSTDLHSLFLPRIRLAQDNKISAILCNKNLKLMKVLPDTLNEMKQLITRLPDLQYFHLPNHLQNRTVLSWLVESSKLHLIPDAYNEESRAKSMSEITFLDLNIFKLEGNLDFLGKLQELREITISYINVSDSQLQFLNKLPKLKRLTIFSTKITGNFLVDSVFLPRIESLNLKHCEIKLDYIKNLSKAHSLKQLTFEGCDISKELFSVISKIPQLNKLSFVKCILEDKTDFSSLFHLRTLVDLCLFDTDISKCLFDPSMSSLYRLNLYKADCSVLQLSSVLKTKGIVVLNLSGNRILLDSQMSFSKLTQMKELYIENCTFNDKALTEISSIRHLDVFHASLNQKYKIDFEVLIKHNNLKSLSIDHTRISEKLVKLLNSYSNTTDIYIPYHSDFNDDLFQLNVPKHKVHSQSGKRE